MRYTYDPVADAANIYLKDLVAAGELVAGVYCDGGDEAKGGVTLSIDKKGKLISIEILQASKFLPPEALHGDQQLCSDPKHHL